jgi:hypothetical protein
MRLSRELGIALITLLACVHLLSHGLNSRRNLALQNFPDPRAILPAAFARPGQCFVSGKRVNWHGFESCFDAPIAIRVNCATRS